MAYMRRNPPRYRDYLADMDEAAAVPGSGPGFVSTVVMKFSDGTWHAVWQGDELLGEFDGTRDQAIAWARSRAADRRFIYSEELGDLVPDDGSDTEFPGNPTGANA